MANTPTPADYIESLMLWMHERPQMYCMYAGELDSVLWYLHMAWAKAAGRETEYQSALETAGLKPRGHISNSERLESVDLEGKATRKVLKFWSKVNTALD